jgi:hypothetical protein
VDNQNANIVKVYGLTGGDIFIKSKYNTEGVVRTFEDLIWALKTFQFENPQVGMIGTFLKKYFKYGEEIKFFEEKNLIDLMKKLLSKSKNHSSQQSLFNLRLSISSKKNNDKELEKKIESLEERELGELMDKSLIDEPRDSPKRRYSRNLFNNSKK